MSSESRERSSGSRSSREKSTKAKAVDAKDKAVKASTKAAAAVKTASKTVGSAVESAADALGGWRSLDKYVRQYNPTFHDFVEKSFLKKMSATSRSSKFLVCLIGLGIVQSTLPLFAWPLDFFARLLSFVFLYNSGVEELRSGFGTSDSKAHKVKSLLTVFLLVSLLELIPQFAFDTTYHFGALWTFLLPVLFFVTPDPKNPKETVAIWIADSIMGQVSNVIDSVVPDAFVGSDQTTTFIGAGILGLLLWSGALGATGSYISVYVFLFVTTTHHVGKSYIKPDESSSGFTKQMTIWHNLMAIWLWRYLISAVEGLSVPGVISVLGWITYHLPSYFLWMTGVFFAMLLTKKTASGSGKANTWYANWLVGKFGAKSSSSSSSRAEGSSARTSSRPAGSSFRPSGSSSSSKKPKK